MSPLTMLRTREFKAFAEVTFSPAPAHKTTESVTLMPLSGELKLDPQQRGVYLSSRDRDHPSFVLFRGPCKTMEFMSI